jgi:hypothetical protein
VNKREIGDLCVCNLTFTISSLFSFTQKIHDLNNFFFELQELFIREIFERGIPKSAFYIHCHGLRSDKSVTMQYTTITLASDLRDAIRNNMPLNGMRPAVSAFLYEGQKGKQLSNTLTLTTRKRPNR